MVAAGYGSLYLIGGSPAGTLIEVWVEGGEDRYVSEVLHLGLLSLQVGNAQIE